MSLKNREKPWIKAFSIVEQHNNFVTSPKAKQCFVQLHLPKTSMSTEIDVRKCRRSALEYNEHPIPIFNPLDEIQKCDGQLGDYNFVCKDVTSWIAARFARELPYTGPRWYWKQATQYMLVNNIITLENITHTLTATSHLPSDFFKHVFGQI